MTNRLLHVRAEGTPREVGLLHGELAKDLIQANLKLYFHRFRNEWGLPKEEVLRRARIYEKVIEEVDGAYAEAMAGVAEGSGMSPLEIVALNVRYEIVYSEYSKVGRELGLPSGCTALSLLPSKTREGHVLMAQNWDWIPGVEGLVQQYRLPGAPEVLAFTEAGIVGGKMGLNSSGLGLLINGLVSNEDNWERLGMPFHVRCWRILRASTLEEASLHVRNSRGSCSANFLMGQALGKEAEVLDLEACPVGTGELRPEDGVLVHANHFHEAEALGIWQPLMEERTSTFQRQERMDELLGQELEDEGRVGLGHVKRFLRDHEGRPNSICRHQEVNLPEVQRYETVISIIMDLDERRMLIASGPPCLSKYRVFLLQGQ
ncbi:MAG: C45 family autoproteolytic acyltransferase/hydrolase [Thermoplasmata archaeon]